MPTLRLDIDQETYARIVDQAVSERRPIDWQAEVTLRRAVGLPFPYSAGDLPTDDHLTITAPHGPDEAVKV